ncbi:hypothetical protein ACQ4PT_056359 [Festuca glaucescens]
MDMEMSLLHCPLCARPLKPPIFQCKGGHIACASCIAAAGEECRNCEHGGCFDVRNTAMDAVVSSARTRCPHVGCQRHVAYHELSDHRSACPHAPCICTEPGCGFAGSRRASHRPALLALGDGPVRQGEPAPGAGYTCKMWATMPTPAAPDSRADIAQVEMKVESSTSPAAVVAVDEASFLTVPPRYLLGDGASKTVPLSIALIRSPPVRSNLRVIMFS